MLPKHSSSSTKDFKQVAFFTYMQTSEKLIPRPPTSTPHTHHIWVLVSVVLMVKY